MNDICIIGNSHLAQVKLNYNAQNMSGIDFYGGGGFSSLYIKDNKLFSEDVKTKNNIRRTNGDEFIPLDKYKHFLIYGCEMPARTGWHWLKYYASASAKIYSENCLRQAYIDHLNVAYGFQLAKMIKKSAICENITIIPGPFPSETHPSVNDELLSCSSPASAREILDKVELISKNYLREYGINLLWNPRELLSKNGFTTDIKYKAKREDDYLHMNPKGAKIVLSNILGYLAP